MAAIDSFVRWRTNHSLQSSAIVRSGFSATRATNDGSCSLAIRGGYPPPSGSGVITVLSFTPKQTGDRCLADVEETRNLRVRQIALCVSCDDPTAEV